MSNIYIYSTLSNDQLYALKDGRSVLIAGKANVADKRLITPRGKATAITEDEFALLQENIVFAAHSRNGFVSAAHHKEDAEKFAEKHLEAADKSAQDTPETAKKRNSKAAKVAGGE